MNGFRDISPGDVLLDNTTLHVVGLEILENKFKSLSPLAEASFFELAESLILHEHIRVEETIFDANEFAQEVANVAKKVISPIRINDVLIGAICEDVIKTITDLGGMENFHNILGESKVAEASHFWNDCCSSFFYGHVEKDPLIKHLQSNSVKIPIPANEDEFIAVRTFLYLFLAQNLNLPYKPNILRAPIIKRILRNQKDKPESFQVLAINKLDQAAQMTIDYVNSNLENNCVKKEIKLPILKNVLPFNPDNPIETIEAALKIRKTSEAQAFRRWCTELDKSLIQGDILKVGRGLKELDTLQKELLDSLRPNKGYITMSIGIPPSISFNLNIPFRRKRHLLFLRDIYKRALKRTP